MSKGTYAEIIHHALVGQWRPDFMNEIIKYLLGVGGTDGQLDQRVKRLRFTKHPQSKLDWAWDNIHAWKHTFMDAHVVRVSRLLKSLGV